MGLIADFGKAVAQFGDRRFRRVLWWALALTVAGLVAVSWALLALLGLVVPDSVSLPWVGPVGFLDDVAFWGALGIVVALSVVMMVPTAAAVVGFFLDEVAAAVEARHYPALPPARETGLPAQIADAARFLGLVIVANLVAFVIYLAVPPLAPFVFWLVNGFLLGREYFALVAARRMDRAAAAALGRRNFWKIWTAGTAMAVPLSVPFLNLVVPIVGVAVFTHQLHRMLRT